MLLPCVVALELRDAQTFLALQVCVWHARTCTPCMHTHVHPADLQPLLALQPPADLALIAWLASVGGLLSFVLLLAELRVVEASSGLTLSIAGIFKEVLTLLASVALLGGLRADCVLSAC